MYRNFDELISALQNDTAKRRCAVASAADKHTLEAVVKANLDGIIEPILIGDEEKIITILREMGVRSEGFEIIHAADEEESAQIACDLVNAGKASAIMKGLMETSTIMRAVLKKENNLRASGLLSAVSLLEIPGYHKLLLTTDPNSTVARPWWVHVVQFALVVGVSALSYYFVEDPIRSGKLGDWLRQRSRQAMPARVLAPALCCAALLGVGAVGVVAVPPTNYASTYAGAAASSVQSDTQSDGGTAQETLAKRIADAMEQAKQEARAKEAQDAASSFDTFFLTPHQTESGTTVYEPLLIGDSVAAGAVDAFYETFPHGHIDAVESRNIWESPYAQYAEAGQVGDYVVFCLGTNNAVVDWQIDDELLGVVPQDKKVFMVNTRNTRDWMAGTNDEIARAPERHPNVVVVDWHGASEGHDEYFAGDGTHLNEVGARAYIDLIRKAIESTL